MGLYWRGAVLGSAEGAEGRADVAFKISFSVAVFWSCSFRRSFSSLIESEFFSSAASLASRSLTWRSFRSRKARWLFREVSDQTSLGEEEIGGEGCGGRGKAHAARF